MFMLVERHEGRAAPICDAALRCSSIRYGGLPRPIFVARRGRLATANLRATEARGDHMAAVSVSGLWLGKPLSAYEQLCIASFAKAGLDTQVFTYDASIVLPPGVRRMDARLVIPESEVFANPQHPGTYAFFSDLFRYRLLAQFDTTWVDMDVLLLGTGLPEAEYLFGFESPGSVACGILRAPRGSAFIEYLVRESAQVDPTTAPWGTIGPLLTTRAIERFGLHAFIQPVDVFYPIHASRIWRLWDPKLSRDVAARVTSSSTIHLWNEVLRRTPEVKTVGPPAGSWIDAKFRDVGIAAPQGELEAHWVRTTWRRSIDGSRPLPLAIAWLPIRVVRKGLKILRRTIGPSRI